VASTSDAAAPAPAPVRAVPDQPAPAAGSHRGAPAQDDALDLGAAVIPILAKTYWKQALGALVPLALLAIVLRRRRAS
jgi:hypothetical protein